MSEYQVDTNVKFPKPKGQKRAEQAAHELVGQYQRAYKRVHGVTPTVTYTFERVGVFNGAKRLWITLPGQRERVDGQRLRELTSQLERRAQS
jgi:hypothetical protein